MMRTKSSAKISAVLSLMVLVPFAAPLATQASGSKLTPKRPNVVFIMTDDHGPWALGVAGNKNAYTPNLNQLARRGAYLKRCFSLTPVCSPARAILMTSRYSSEVNIPDFLHAEREPGRYLSPEFATWPKLFAEAGYDAALSGKWHLNFGRKGMPTDFGYEEYLMTMGISINPSVNINGQSRRMDGYTPDIITDFGLEFIRRKRSAPFLLSLHFFAPHANWGNRTPDGDRTWLPVRDEIWDHFKNSDPELPRTDIGGLDTARTKRMMREYLASVAAVDRNIKRLVDTLAELGIAEDTIIVFTADQGFSMGHNGIWHKGNGRWLLKDDPDSPRPNMYDNSLLTPSIVCWPGTIAGSTVVEESITFLDWFPTLLAMASIPLPDGATIRGRNFFPLLKGTPMHWDEDVFAQYTMWDWHQTGAKLRAYRTAQWKLVRDYAHEGKDEFYDIIRDPTESTNLIHSTNQTIRQAIVDVEGKMLAQMKDIGDPLLELAAAK